MSDDQKDDKKQKVLHTRVSEGLDEELRRRAAELGISVSNLVRNALQNTFDMVEDVVADTGRMVLSATSAEKQRTRGAPSTTTRSTATETKTQPLGYQEMLLAQNAICVDCNAILAKGGRGALIVCQPSSKDFLCLSCVQERVEETSND